MSAIDDILQQRQKQETKPAELEEAGKYYSALVGDAIHEHFLEMRFSNGLQTAFAYSDLMWFNHDPESGTIDLAFGGFLVTLKGRGLAKLFHHIKQKRVGWVKEADTEMEDHAGNDTFIESISITPPKEFEEESES